MLTTLKFPHCLAFPCWKEAVIFLAVVQLRFCNLLKTNQNQYTYSHPDFNKGIFGGAAWVQLELQFRHDAQQICLFSLEACHLGLQLFHFLFHFCLGDLGVPSDVLETMRSKVNEWIKPRTQPSDSRGSTPTGKTAVLYSREFSFFLGNLFWHTI